MWHVEEGGDGEAVIMDSDNSYVAEIVNYQRDDESEEEADKRWETNIWLIETAPEMLEALKAVQEATQGWVMCGKFWDAMQMVNAAIKKAVREE